MATDVMIQDELCEYAVLGTIMASRNAFTEVREILDEDCFYSYIGKDVWKAVVRCADKGVAPDMVGVLAELGAMRSRVEMVTVGQICQKVVWEDLLNYAYRLRDLKIRRRLWVLGQELAVAGVSEAKQLSDVQADTVKAIEDIFTLRGTDSVKTLGDAIDSVFGIIRDNLLRKSPTTGSETGFKELDRRGGLQPSDLIIIAGDSSNGKSSMAMNIAFHASQKGDKVAVYSMEMMAPQLAARILSSRSGIPSSRILYDGTLSGYDYDSVAQAAGEIDRGAMFFDDTSTSSLDSILNSIRSMVARYGIKGAIVDYLQILNVNERAASPEQAMGDAARRLKNIAKELGIWVIALSQLARDKENPRPTRNRLRSSGQIFEAADVVMYIYRPELYGRPLPQPFDSVNPAGKAFIDVDKGRNMGTFSFLTDFNAETTTFADYDAVCEPQETSPSSDPLEGTHTMDAALPF